LVTEFGYWGDRQVAFLVFAFYKTGQAIAIHCTINLLDNGATQSDGERMGDSGSFGCDYNLM
jgi:hypothetical protein